MNIPIFGRTNAEFPSVWFEAADHAGLRNATSPAVIDVSGNPARWGHEFGPTPHRLIAFGGRELETARDEQQAADFITAHLISTLSCMGGKPLDIFFLRVRRALEDHQITGALRALEEAKGEELIRFLGLSIEGPPLAVTATWRFHDAFETLCIAEGTSPADLTMIRGIAAERRVGVVRRLSNRDVPPTNEAVLIPGVLA
jgi:hypothetical protein